MKYTEEEKKSLKFLTDKRDEAYGLMQFEDGEIYQLAEEEFNNYLTIEEIIDKQQKEIEEQNKEINEKDKLLKFTRNYINKLEQDLFENASNYVISKDRIRKNIKELNDNRPYLSKFDDWKEKEYTNEDVTNKCVEILEDLLGDE